MEYLIAVHGSYCFHPPGLGAASGSRAASGPNSDPLSVGKGDELSREVPQ